MSKTLEVLQKLRTKNLYDQGGPAKHSSAYTWAINTAIDIYSGRDPTESVIKLVEWCMRDAKDKRDQEAA